jgi:cytochrome c oxidase subunit III
MGIIVEDAIKAPHRPEFDRSGGNGSGVFTPKGPRFLASRENPPSGSTAIWVGIAAIIMMFAALTSALVVRQGASMDWHHFDLPKILYFNTLILAASSVTLAMFGRRFRQRWSSSASVDSGSRWLYATLVLGATFVAGQYLAWHQLYSEGLYMASNPSHSFFYVLTGGHVLHLLGGLIALIYVTAKLKRFTLRQSTLSMATKYWHFMDLLWLYLLGLLWLKM